MSWDKLSMQEKAEIMRLAVQNGVYNLDSIRDGYNEYAKGGKIHIKPENRGKFTALKKRTGHSASWFKAHGTPAQKKMAVFALNARKWKHGDGGNLYGSGRDMSDVDTRSDTTRVGYHEGTPAYGAVDAPNTAGLWDLLNYNITGNPHIITGEPPLPIIGKIPASDITKNLLKMLGKPASNKPIQPLSKANIGNLAAENYGHRYPGVEKQIELFRQNDVDLSKIGVEDLDDILKLRREALSINAPTRHTIATPSGEGYRLTDYKNGRIVGNTDLYIDKSGNAHMDNIKNVTEHFSPTDPRRVHDVQRNGLNAAIAVAKSEGGEGVITGSYLQSAPKQYPSIFEHPEREIIGKGFHTNEKIVEEPFGGINGPKEAKSVEELWTNGDKEAMQLREAPVWKLTKQTRTTPTKADVFNPIIVDENGVMHTDWNTMDIFKGLAFPLAVGTTINKSRSNGRKTKK